MAGEDQVRVTGTDIEAVSERLQRLYQDLPEGERAVLGWLLKRAEEAPAEDDVTGQLRGFSSEARIASVSSTVAPQLARSLGVPQLQYLNRGQLAGVSVTVGVMVS